MQYRRRGALQDRESQSDSRSIGELVRDDAVMRHVQRIAERHAWLPRDHAAALDLVADVIGELAAGIIARDERTPAVQLRSEVRRRAKRHRRETARKPEISLEQVDASELVDEEAHPKLAYLDSRTRDATAIVSLIRRLADGDVPALRLLDLQVHHGGRTFRRRHADMPPAVYRGARQRLASYAAVATTMAATWGAAADDGGEVARNLLTQLRQGEAANDLLADERPPEAARAVDRAQSGRRG